MIFAVMRSLGHFNASLVVRREVDDRGEHGADDDPEELIPIEERHADPGRCLSIVEGGPEDCDELDKKEQVPPLPRSPLLSRPSHRVSARSRFAPGHLFSLSRSQNCGTHAIRRCWHLTEARPNRVVDGVEDGWRGRDQRLFANSLCTKGSKWRGIFN